MASDPPSFTWTCTDCPAWAEQCRRPRPSDRGRPWVDLLLLDMGPTYAARQPQTERAEPLLQQLKRLGAGRTVQVYLLPGARHSSATTARERQRRDSSRCGRHRCVRVQGGGWIDTATSRSLTANQQV